VVACFRAVFDRAKTIADTIKRKLREASIMVLRKPIDAPIKLDGTISLISGDVEEITIAKPMPYPMESSSNIGNCVVNGTASNI
jgi:hypothetical protein